MGNHIERVEEVLDPDELCKIGSIEEDVNFLGDIHFMAGVPHIDCSGSSDGVSIEIEPMWKNPYVIKTPKKKGLPIKFGRASYGDLFGERRKIKDDEFLGSDKLSFHGRERLIRREHSLRANDIMIHKFYLSEVMERDVGLVVASAHWLKTVGSDFYSDSEEHYTHLGVPFAWEGLERAVGLSAVDRGGNDIMYVVGCSKDFLREENWAQLFAGFSGKNKACVLARERLNVLHDSKYFCVLHNPTEGEGQPSLP